MALKQLMINKKIQQRKSSLEELLTQEADLNKRAAELEVSIDAENSLDAAKLDLEKKTKAYDYNKVMYDNGEISQQDLNDKKIEYENAKNTYDKSSVSLEAKKINAKQSLDEAKTSYENAKASADDKSNRLAFEDKKKNNLKVRLINYGIEATNDK